MRVPLLGRDLRFVCLDCRAALDEGEGCPEDGEHEGVSVEDGHGRRRLLARLWSAGRAPPSAILEALLRRFELPWLSGPQGGVAPSVDRRQAGIAAVAEGEDRPLARSLIFLFEDSSRRALLLRDARTSGFRIAPAGRPPILIRPGRLHLTGFAERTSATADDAVTRELFPFNVVFRSLVLPGDVVVLHSAVDEEVDRASPPGLYRDRPATRHVARPPVILSVGRSSSIGA